MALMACRECGQQVSTKAAACPHCGAPNPASDDRQAEPDRAAAENKRKGSLVGFAAFLAIAAVIAIIIETNTGNSPTNGQRPSVCGASNVSLSNIQYSYDGFASKVTGNLRQNCLIAVAVELKWTGYYADGSVAFSDDEWPNSTSNIPPNIDFPFELTEPTKIAPTTYTLAFVGAKPW